MARLLYPNLDIGSSYNVSFFAPAILGAGLSNAELASILDYSSAVALADVTGRHSSVLSSLPSGTPADASKLVYLKFISSSNEPVVVAQDWISQPPVLVTATSATFVVDGISATDIPKINALLAANGYSRVTVQ